MVYARAGKKIKDHERDNAIVLMSKIPILVKNINSAKRRKTPAPKVVTPPPKNNKNKDKYLKQKFPYE